LASQPRRRRDAALEVGITVRAPRARLGQVLPTAAKLYCALAATRRRLGVALRKIDTLRIQGALLEQEVVLLKAEAATARQFAYHDELTGLPNRRLLLDRFNQALARGARRHGQVAILLVDLDRFKSINDEFGHTAGDGVLQQVATRLVGCIRASDTACRFGGDEFLILLPEPTGEQGAVVVAEKTRAHLAMPYFISGNTIEITISIGIAIYPVHGEEYAELIRRADQEMYCDKASRRAPSNVSAGGARAIVRTRATE
jgi:diguanylate cyclase (GGDEF)-like protein